MSSSTKTPANAGIGEPKPNLFDAEGAIGKQFTGMLWLIMTPYKLYNRLTGNKENGAVGGAAQAVGGPLAKDGVVGKQFTTDGSIGGSVQSALGSDKPIEH
jgi:hypothetical protein